MRTDHLQTLRSLSFLNGHPVNQNFGITILRSAVQRSVITVTNFLPACNWLFLPGYELDLKPAAFSQMLPRVVSAKRWHGLLLTRSASKCQTGSVTHQSQERRSPRWNLNELALIWQSMSFRYTALIAGAAGVAAAVVSRSLAAGGLDHG